MNGKSSGRRSHLGVLKLRDCANRTRGGAGRKAPSNRGLSGAGRPRVTGGYRGPPSAPLSAHASSRKKHGLRGVLFCGQYDSPISCL